MVPIIHMNTLNPDPKVCAVQPSVRALARYWVGLGRGPRPAQRYAACACKNELRSEKSDKLNFSTRQEWTILQKYFARSFLRVYNICIVRRVKSLEFRITISMS